MANFNAIGNDLTIYKAFLSLANAAPGKTNFDYHRAYIADYSLSSYMQALNDVFVGFSDKAMGDLMVANLGLGAVVSSAEAEAYLASAADRVAAVIELTTILSNYSGTNADVLAAQTAYNNKIGFAVDYSNANNAQSNFPDTFAGSSFMLTTGIDTLIGTANADSFVAFINDNSNTLNSNDSLQGGAGIDALLADIGNAQNFAITPVTTGIENAAFRVQAQEDDYGDNNIAGVGIIDAERMNGVQNWEDNGSRADLVIEDVRILDTEITKDITITMRDTDPGHVDFGVYFDQNSLRNFTDTASFMNLRVLDTYAVAQGLDELQDSPYGSFTFWYSLNSGAYLSATLASDAMQDAQTLDEMVIAMRAAADTLFGAGVVAVELGSSYTVTDSVTDDTVSGREIVMTAQGNVTFDVSRPGSGWLATETVPAVSGLYTSFNQEAESTTSLVTSTVILDNVGRGSNGGDLVIGGLSVGDTSDSKGVQRFDITVEDNSKLQTINSTNNTLREVYIVNGVTDEMSDAYTTTVTNAGNLTVLGTVDGGDVALPGTDDQHNEFGFSDVRIIDGSAMTGKLTFDAEITSASLTKYLNATDTANNPTADNVRFEYSGGNNNDTIAAAIDGEVVGSIGALGSREDFIFTLNGNDGNDNLTVTLDAESANWIINQRENANVTINGGAGNDTINAVGDGDIIINAGAGNDTVYADNGGDNAVWVVANDGGTLVDLVGDPANNTPVFLYKGELTVTYSGAGDLVTLAGGVTSGNAAALTNGWEKTVSIPTGENYSVNQYYINQAIKNAINNDAVLSKLLKAADGPMNTLTITSLVDGDVVAEDLLIEVSGPDLLTDVTTASEIATVEAAYQKFSKDSDADLADADLAQDATYVWANGVNGMDANQELIQAGVDSTLDTEDTIDLGAGTDVLVLSTGAGNQETVVFTAASGVDATIVNFDDDTIVPGNGDLLDFTAFLTSKVTISGSTVSQNRILTTLSADLVAEANEVIVVDAVTAAFDLTDTFAGLTAAKLLAAIDSSNAGAADFAGFTTGTLSADDNAPSTGAGALVGKAGNSIVLVENTANLGEYAIFHMTFDGTATNTTNEFSTASLVGVVDFGATVDFTSVLV
jgi:hypothetical protein